MSDVGHYMTKGAECIDVIMSALTPEEFEGYCKGNMIKYIYRAGDKDEKAKDLHKAFDYSCMLAHRVWVTEYAEEVRDDEQA